jgi:hypothetical protein
MAKIKKSMSENIVDIMRKGTSKWTKTRKAEERSPSSGSSRRVRMTIGRSKSVKDAAAEIMESAYMKASGNDTLPANARQIMYAARGQIRGDPKTFTYNRAFDETDDGVPYVSEFAFGVHRDGLIAGRGPRRKEITGVNWSPGIKNPFRELGRGGAGMDTILSEVRANISQPVIVALHLACPRVAYTDRGKSAIVVEGKAEGYDHDED